MIITVSLNDPSVSGKSASNERYQSSYHINSRPNHLRESAIDPYFPQPSIARGIKHALIVLYIYRRAESTHTHTEQIVIYSICRGEGVCRARIFNKKPISAPKLSPLASCSAAPAASSARTGIDRRWCRALRRNSARVSRFAARCFGSSYTGKYLFACCCGTRWQAICGNPLFRTLSAV